MELNNITQAKTSNDLTESDNSDEEKIQPEPPFPKFIILESLEDTPLSPFLSQKIVSTNISPKIVKKWNNNN